MSTTPAEREAATLVQRGMRLILDSCDWESPCGHSGWKSWTVQPSGVAVCGECGATLCAHCGHAEPGTVPLRGKPAT